MHSMPEMKTLVGHMMLCQSLDHGQAVADALMQRKQVLFWHAGRE